KKFCFPSVFSLGRSNRLFGSVKKGRSEQEQLILNPVVELCDKDKNNTRELAAGYGSRRRNTALPSGSTGR
ncbi:MAG: hypothetical protein AAFN44_21180, partial [Pseudomonadota bacterium]